MVIEGLYAGTAKTFGPRQESSAIVKQPQDSVVIEAQGIVTDTQADRRFHGGPHKALHQYSLVGYEILNKRFPLLHRSLHPGVLGENLTIADMDDESVCIGDTYRMGEVVLQVSGPRIPCWKINHRLNWPDVDKFIAKRAICGWYFRVLEGGTLQKGYSVERTAQPHPGMSVASLVRVIYDQQASASLLSQWATLPSLEPLWQERLAKRADKT
ncbi:MOSC domain-containing protein [Aestuariibacter halophilus]|uniref:MOSC domain-containing protein n=1 Tax=Fluctibacter halophilus TaxID=226011 RepID=A0ABS8GAT9_9ALTE|nr:MOSC domain-containing protein [Aestuariibacter halophilus]MCC2617690.1 MOSC domain-containing protein [Aestuariibacter halophilus]